jgi:hypothetical protein
MLIFVIAVVAGEIEIHNLWPLILQSVFRLKEETIPEEGKM